LNFAVIDASALIAFLEGEVGADVIDAEIDGAMISAVNFGEVAQHQFRNGKSRSEMERLADELGLIIIPVDYALALDAADIREIGRSIGLSQADCICLALAKQERSIVFTSDRSWLKIADELGVEVELIR
jgi:ribonuclease VapC